MWKKVGKSILFPPRKVLLCLIPIAIFSFVYAAILYTPEDGITIGSYVVSFYTLMIVCVRIPELIRWGQKLKRENKYIVLYRSDVRLRVKISLYGTLAFNTAYALLQLGTGVYHGSAWFFALALYYIALAMMRFFLLKHTLSYDTGEHMEYEMRKYRLCGIFLLVLNTALAVMIAYMVWNNKEVMYHEITMIAMATYTFTAFVLAVVNMINYRKFKSPVYSAAKMISLISACVSMLTLENAMLTTFGTAEEEGYRQLMMRKTGAVVSVFVVGVAIYMIISSSRWLHLTIEK